MTSPNSAANWAAAKRFMHWGIAIAVVVALLAPKPEDGQGLVHIAAGTSAVALALTRIVWRIVGGVRPFLRDALRLKLPDPSRGARAFAPLLLQGARLMGFAFLALIPVAAGLALAGIGQGEDSPLLEAHEAAGTAVMALAIAHAAAVILFSILIKYDVIAITLTGGVGALAEGGARGAAGLALGAVLSLAAFAYVWGPFDIAGKAAALSEQGEAGEHEWGEDDD